MAVFPLKPVWKPADLCCYDGAYGEKVIDTREDDHFTCTLGEEYEDELWVVLT